MASDADESPSVRGGPFVVEGRQVDPATNRVIHDGAEVRLEPKVMRVLVELAARADRTMTREELESVVWRGMVVGPDALTNAIIKLRRALGDDARTPRIIETIPKRGYRLIGAVSAAGDPVPAPLQRKLCAILYADVAGYSRLSGEDEDSTHRALRDGLDRFADSIRENRGAVVNYAGDAVLAEFPTVSDALGCAVEVQREFGPATGQQKIAFRIGVNIGEVIVDRGDIYGDGVNVAARLEALADPGGICVSEAARAAAGNKVPVDYEFMGEQSVKNIANPVRAYRVLFFPAGRPHRGRRPGLAVGAAGAVLLTACAALLAYWWLSDTPVDAGNAPRPTAVVPGDKPVIAVLPFANVGLDATDEYFADGLTDDMITDLSRVSGLDVIARGTVFTYKNRVIDVPGIARELGASHLLEGSVRRVGDAVRINVQLVDAVNNRHLWAQRFDRAKDEFFALQDDVVARVVQAVAVELTEQEKERIARPPTRSLEAYDQYLRAEQSGYLGGPLELPATLALYRRAIEIDPQFADAHAGLARAAVEAWREDSADLMSGAHARSIAYESASRALEIDPANGRAYTVLAVLQLAEGHHETAIDSARTAVRLSPGQSQAYLDLGLVLAMSGFVEEASTAIESAFRLNPKPAPDSMLYAGIVEFFAERYERAIESISRVRDVRASSTTVWIYLAAANGLLGRGPRASEAVEGLLQRYPQSSLEQLRVAYSYLKRPADLERLLVGLEKAGLPRWPYAVSGHDADRLGQSELSDIAMGRTWIGRHLKGLSFVQEIGEDGRLVYRSEQSLQSGTVSIRDAMLCQRIRLTVLNQELCGHVFRNPSGSPGGQDEYLVVMPDSVRYFTVLPRAARSG